MSIIGLHLGKTNLQDDNDFYKTDLDNIIHDRVLAWYNKSEKCAALK